MTSIKAWCKAKGHTIEPYRDYYELCLSTNKYSCTIIYGKGVRLAVICKTLMELDKFQWPVDKREDWEKTKENCS